MSETNGHSPGDRPKGFIPAIVSGFLTGKGAPLLLVFSLCLGAAAIFITPREEEPQIVVPMADVMVQAPGASAREVEHLVASPLERILWQIDGVEYVYSTSRRDSAVATVRFYVGEDREDSLIKLHNAIRMNTDAVPNVVSGWVVKPVEVDDVPIVTATLWSETYDDHDLRRIGEELYSRLAEVENVSRIRIIGGRPREVRVELSPERMAGLSVTPMAVTRALQGADVSVTAGTMDRMNREISVSTDSFLADPAEVGDLVVGVFDGRPVYLRDVARIVDGPAEAESYTRIGFSDRYLADTGRESAAGELYPAVTLAVAKKKGTNAVDVARVVIDRLHELERTVVPDGVEVRTTRNYGQTAQDKVGDLLNSLFFAIVTVVALLALTLGWREALIVAAAVPVSFALSLFSSMVLGFTINRVTLFALILSLGLVVDDPITNVDNIQRHILAGKRKPFFATLFGVREVLPPVLMSTLAIIVSFTPMFFITGMMGPYMAPMAANVPLTVTFSTLCALTVVPWLSYQLLKNLKPRRQAAEELEEGPQPPGWAERIYRPVMTPFLSSRLLRWVLLALILLGLAGSMSLALFRQVPLKMLPFDNKNEFQLVLDAEEGTSLEAMDRVVRRFESYLRTVPEVTDFTSYAGTNSAMDFNAMVRHYYLRTLSWQADIRVSLATKDEREMQSHAIVLRLRPELERLAAESGVNLAIVESPPGPPVIATVTAEVYGAPDRSHDQLIEAAKHVRAAMAAEQGVTDLDVSFESPHERMDFLPDKEKAALHGVDTGAVAGALRMAVTGDVPAHVHLPLERQPLAVRTVLPRELRSSTAALGRIPLRSQDPEGGGVLVPLAELGDFTLDVADQPIYHKNLRRVVYVFAEMAGRAPGEAILDIQSRLKDDPLPPGTAVEWAGEGEWKITLRVFRDLGLAFGAALLGIYILLILQTNSYTMPLLIMTAIPLTLLGIMPGFWLLNVFFAPAVGELANPVFFTATSMIGMIALGGIVIRNSLVLIEFIQDSLDQGLELREAVLQSGAVRLRPIVLTAVTTALGAWPITLDPIFSGLAWALIFGLVASTLFTLVVIPTAYYAVRLKRHA